MNNKIIVWFTAISMIGLTACHKNRISKTIDRSAVDVTTVLTDSNKAPKPDSTSPVAEVISPVKIQEIAFDYLTAKSKFSFEGKTQNFNNTNVNIRMKKDSLIWISVTGLGLEVARGLISKDSIVFMDKIHKDYFVFTYAQLSKQYNFELNFPLMQSIIIGNLPFPRQSDSQFTKQDDFFLLKQNKERLSIENYIDQNNLKLARLNATEAGTNNTFSLDYQDFKNVSSSLFPFSSLVKLNVISPKDQQRSETTISLKHSKVEIVNQSPGFPFSVPSNYKRKR